MTDISVYKDIVAAVKAAEAGTLSFEDLSEALKRIHEYNAVSNFYVPRASLQKAFNKRELESLSSAAVTLTLYSLTMPELTPEQASASAESFVSASARHYFADTPETRAMTPQQKTLWLALRKKNLKAFLDMPRPKIMQIIANIEKGGYLPSVVQAIRNEQSILPVNFRREVLKYQNDDKTLESVFKTTFDKFMAIDPANTENIDRGFINTLNAMSSRQSAINHLIDNIANTGMSDTSPDELMRNFTTLWDTVFENATDADISAFIRHNHLLKNNDRLLRQVTSNDSLFPQRIQDAFVEASLRAKPDSSLPWSNDLLQVTTYSRDITFSVFDRFLKVDPQFNLPKHNIEAMLTSWLDLAPAKQFEQKIYNQVADGEEPPEDTLENLLLASKEGLRQAFTLYTSAEIESIIHTLDRYNLLGTLTALPDEDTLFPEDFRSLINEYMEAAHPAPHEAENGKAIGTKNFLAEYHHQLQTLINIQDTKNLSEEELDALGMINLYSSSVKYSLTDASKNFNGGTNYELISQRGMKLGKGLIRKAMDKLTKSEINRLIVQLDKLGVLESYKSNVIINDSLFPTYFQKMIQKYERQKEAPPPPALTDKKTETQEEIRNRIYQMPFQERLNILLHAGDGDFNDLETNCADIILSVSAKSHIFLRFMAARNTLGTYPPSTESQVARDFRDKFKKAFNQFTPREIDTIILQFHKFGILADMKERIEDGDSVLPTHIQKLIQKFEAPSPVPLIEAEPADNAPEDETIADELQDETIETIEAPVVTETDTPEEVPEAPLQDYLQVIEVDDLLTEIDDPTDIIGGVRTRERDEDEPKIIRTQPRLDWLLRGLEQDGFKRADMLLYKERAVEGSNIEVSPYVVLEAMKGHHHFQVAVCQTLGNSTYVIRKPIDFTSESMTTTAELRKRDDVFKISCYNDKQWIKSIRHHAYVPLDDLDIQLKTRIGWADKKNAAIESFGEFVLDTGHEPFTNDDSIIQHGADYDPSKVPSNTLKGRTTYKRLYFALNAGAISGLENVRNFRQLKEYIFGDEPVSASALRTRIEEVKPPVLQARSVFAAVANLFVEQNTPDLSALVVDGNNIEKIRLAFGSGTVMGLDEFIESNDNENPDDATSVEQFTLAAGLAMEKEDGAFVSAPKPLLRRILQGLNND